MAALSSPASFRLSLQAGGEVLASAEARSGERVDAAHRPRLRQGVPAYLTIVAPEGTHVRARMGSEVLVALARGGSSPPIDLLHRVGEEFGEVEVVLEESAGDEADSWRSLIRLEVEVLPPPGVEAMFEAIVRDLEEAHVGLAQDLLGRAVRKSGSSWPPRALRPQEDLSRLEDLRTRLDRTLRRIGDQPSLSMVRVVRKERWRPGDRCDARIGLEMARAGIRVGSGMAAPLGKVVVSRTELTSDIAEHRHLREGIGRLARWSEGLGTFCRRSAVLLAAEEERWGAQVYEERYLPRIHQLEEFAGRAGRLAAELRRTIVLHPFLRGAGPPRSPFGPTPIFLGRDAYREAYRLLREARRFGVQVDAEGTFRTRFKRFSTLYEYWCFIRVVRALRDRLGPPEARDAFTLIDDVYRPDLAPGQSFRFRLPGRISVTVTYEPEFPPVSARSGATYAAALVTAPLRPDVVVEVRREGGLPAMLALDAKSTRAFRREALWDVRDYRGLIHDPRTGHQPVRQLFLLHADAAARPLVNLTGYLEGAVSGEGASVLGAVPCVPGDLRSLEKVLDRFLDLWIVR